MTFGSCRTPAINLFLLPINDSLCNDVILNVLKSDYSDYEKAAHNPDEFVALDNDICDLKANPFPINLSNP